VPKLHVLKGPDRGRVIDVTTARLILGRTSQDLPLIDNAVSREHAEIQPENGHWVLADLKSSNGTYVNGERLRKPVTLHDGDKIRVGGTTMMFRLQESVERLSGEESHDFVDLDAISHQFESSILSSVPNAEESLIIATPETAEAVHAWHVMYDVAESIGGIGEVHELLERITDIVFKHFTVDCMFVLMKDREGRLKSQIVRYRSKHNRDGEKVVGSRTIINHVVEKREGILCANAMTDKRFANSASAGSIANMALRSVICVPIVCRNDVHGVMHVDCSMAQHTYTHEQLRLMTAIGRLAGMAVENVKLVESRVRNERLAATGETVAYLSHHVRNILQGMRSGSDVLEMGLARERIDLIRSGWGIVQRNQDRTMQLVSNMLTFSKDREPRIESIQLNRIIEEVVRLVELRAHERGVDIECELGELPPLPLDSDGIHQVVLNIMTNALDVVPDKNGRVTVTTIFDEAGNCGVLTISDNGPGIPKAELDTIFNAFHSSKGQGGTGLGLAAAKKIVTELHGKITVTSKADRGTTFRICLSTEETAAEDSEKTRGPT
jgi:signal transduction histidine kinase/pSer/pThr/pTyr-binding forkhead associated (FHA) protein